MAIRNAALAETAKVVNALSNTSPSTSTPAFISMKGYNRLSIIINVKNGSTVTGSAITLTQATTVTNTSGKALAFSTVFQNVDTAASDALTSTAVASNTFTTNSTNSKLLMYVIEVKASDLDVANNFDCVRLNTADAVNTTLTATYILSDPRYADTTPITAVAN